MTRTAERITVVFTMALLVLALAFKRAVPIPPPPVELRFVYHDYQTFCVYKVGPVIVARIAKAGWEGCPLVLSGEPKTQTEAP